MQSAKHFLDLDGSESPEEVDDAYRRFEPLKARLDKYFFEMQPMIKAEKKGDIDNALRVAMEQIAELPKWVDLFLAAYRKLDVGFPCVFLATRYLPVLSRQEDANVLREQIAKRPELVAWYQRFLVQMNADFAMAATLREFLKANADCIQDKIAKSTALAGRDVARLIKTMERARVVTRKKAGKTHLVRLAGIGR